jgi:hypothetical protein
MPVIKRRQKKKNIRKMKFLMESNGRGYSIAFFTSTWEMSDCGFDVFLCRYTEKRPKIGCAAETAATFGGNGVEWREMCVRLGRTAVLQDRAENLRATCFVIQNCALSVCFVWFLQSRVSSDLSLNIENACLLWCTNWISKCCLVRLSFQ